MSAKPENPLMELKKAGQSVWLDYLSKEILKKGALKKLIEEDGLTGVTSNPSIFQKAISSGPYYNGSIHEMIGKNISDPKELFLGLAIADVKEAADLLLPVYEATSGLDGYVSLEVSPDLAYDTEATMEEARELFRRVGKKNIYVKVPATREGLPAIETLIGEGINVNVTLLFSVERYKEVINAYIGGLEKLRDSGKKGLSEVSSVASFFVSRVDTLADKMLLEKYSQAQDYEKRSSIKALMGRAAAANAKIAYQVYKKAFSEKRFQELSGKGARVQRILWASTSTKNPEYSDIKYVEELIGPDSVNTMPEETISAFRDHGTVRVSILDDVRGAETILKELRDHGVDIDYVTAELESDGVEKFSDSFKAVLKAMAEKRDALLARK
ncbi:MAG: transaldolase [Nitrospiraceae bacterium]|nr:transaldolase [Nitrospiraceae bacterium]